jgi:hypothetical protein
VKEGVQVSRALEPQQLSLAEFANATLDESANMAQHDYNRQMFIWTAAEANWTQNATAYRR